MNGKYAGGRGGSGGGRGASHSAGRGSGRGSFGAASPFEDFFSHSPFLSSGQYSDYYEETADEYISDYPMESSDFLQRGFNEGYSSGYGHDLGGDQSIQSLLAPSPSVGRGFGRGRGFGSAAPGARGRGGRGRGGPAEMGRGARGRGRGRGGTGRGGTGAPIKEPPKAHWCTSCNVCCTSAELLLAHMNGKKHTAKVVKLAQAAKAGKAEANGNQQRQQQQLPMAQQQQQPGGKKRKAEAPKQSKPLMIGIEGNQYWCFPCSVSAVKFELLQVHLDGKKHSAKIKVLGGAEIFAPPQPLGPLPENPTAAAAVATSTAPPAKKPKTGTPPIPPPPVIVKPVAAAPPSGQRQRQPPPQESSQQPPTAVTGIRDNMYWCFPCNVTCNRLEQLEIHLGGKKHQQKITIFGGPSRFLPHEDLGPLPIPPPSAKSARVPWGPTRQISPDDDPIPKTEVRPAWWCNVCNVACHSDKLLRRHLTTKRHIGSHESYGELGSKFLSAENWLGPPYGRSQAQIGMKDSSFFCYLCEVKLSNGKEIEVHLRSEDHADKIRVGENNAEADYVAELEEGAAAEATEGGEQMVVANGE